MTTSVPEKSLSGKDGRIARAAAAAIREQAPDAEIILFGSRAGGVANADSDFDLLVVADTEDRFALAMHLTEVLEQVRDLPAFDLVVIPRSEWETARRRYGFIAREADMHGVRVDG